MRKDFTTYEQQVSILKGKGIVVSDEVYALECLKTTSYYGLINGYKGIFKNKDRKYHKGVAFEDLMALYDFDTELNNLLFKNILKVERKIKSLVSYHFCREYGDRMESYLDAKNYTTTERNIENVKKLIATFNYLLNPEDSYRKKHYIEHYLKQHKNVPLWVATTALTLGNVSKMYSLLKDNVKIGISKEYNIEHTELDAMLKLLKNFRNICAHNERVFNYKSSSSIANNEIIDNLTEGSNLKQNGKRNVLAVIVCFEYLLDRKSFFTFVYELFKLYKSSKLKFPYNEKVLKEMGLSKSILEKLFRSDGDDILSQLLETDIQMKNIKDKLM